MIATAADAPKPNNQPLVELVSKTAAIGFVIVYAVGYLIVSLYYSTLGIGDVDLLKPKVGAAGFAFVLFFGLSLWITLYIGGMKWVDELLGPDNFGGSVLKGCFLFLATLVMGAILSQMFDLDAAYSELNNLAFVCCSIIIFVICTGTLGFSSARAMLKRHQAIVISVGVVAVFVCVTTTFVGSHGLGVRKISSLLYVAGLYQFGLYSAIKKPEKRRTENWPIRIAELILPVTLFTGILYPHLKSAWGGGAPRQAMVLFTKDSIFGASKQYRLRIIEDDDRGLYFLPAKSEQAIFVPRVQVQLIYFADHPLLPEALQQ